ncbi:hypothetical protein ACFLZR_00360, partial [Candidatus Neomarinimicrobiota bacterium]
MKIYYLGLKKAYPDIKRIDVVWHFLRHGRDIVIEDVQWNAQRIIILLKKRIQTIIKRETELETLTPAESVLCNWCYYWSVCPAKEGQTHPARQAERM